ncbi:Uma2 family endonuclease [Sorangium sp. So ce1078]|uniref:Uma2 family endonuclease n=1 Tax=Sorangium sp. So ce1078 TaxID=3133329 RepID=UPI003F5E0858
MGQPAEKQRRATYADLEAVPPNKVAELVRGTLHVFPRPAPRHARASSRLGVKLGGPFDLGDGGPGGWTILVEPELHFPDPDAPGEIDALVPDLAGWRRERMPELPETAYFSLAPDWICEVLSPSTAAFDRDEKIPIYAREGVRHAWLLDPIARTLEVHVLGEDRRWGPAVVHRDAARVHVEPFDAIELDLSVLWAK